MLEKRQVIVKYLSTSCKVLEQDMYIFVQDLSSFSSIFVQYICPLFSWRLVLVIQVKLETELEVEVEEEGAGATNRDNTASLSHFWLFWKRWNFLSHIVLVQALLSNSKQDIQSLPESPLEASKPS